MQSRFCAELAWQSPSLACPASECYCGVGSSVHLGAGICRSGIGVVATVALEGGNGPHRFAGLFALGGANLLTSGFLTLALPLFCFFSLDLFGKGLLFENGLGFGWNRPLLFLPSCMPLFSFAKRKWFHLSTPGPAGWCFNGVIFSKHVDPLDCSSR